MHLDLAANQKPVLYWAFTRNAVGACDVAQPLHLAWLHAWVGSSYERTFSSKTAEMGVSFYEGASWVGLKGNQRETNHFGGFPILRQTQMRLWRVSRLI